MFYKLFFQILLVLIVIMTSCICTMKPKMHESLMVYNSDYELKLEDDNKEDTVKLATMPQVNTEKKEIQNIQPEVKTIPAKKKQAPVIKKEKTITQPVKKTEEKKEIAIPKQTKQKTEESSKVLTPQQEEIQWNIWRSNLQNQIMKDTKLPILPQGTIFKFRFNVDKYGKITNVQTWSLTPAMTPYAIQYIAPVIRSYQGKAILNFPTGSNRMSTTVEGGWKISTNARYTTPSDYNDSEVIRK